MGERREKICSLEEAISEIKDGFTIGLSGTPLSNEPFVLIRALIRKGIKNLTSVVCAAGMGSDLLIGAGSVRKIVSTGLTIQNYAPIGPNFRRAIEQEKRLEVWECDFIHWHCAIKAAAWNMPCLYTKAGLGTDLPRVNPDLKIVEVNGEAYIAVPPISIDACIFYASKSDPYGNVIFNGMTPWEYALARACKGPIIVAAEEIIPNKKVREEPRLVTLCGAIAADYVVEIPYGAHPDEGQGYYEHDSIHIKEYVAAAEATRQGKNLNAFEDYLNRYIFEPKNQAEYLEAIGGISRLVELKQSLI